MILWRIAADTRRYAADDLSGGGAAAYPGRWNEEQQPVLYTAPTIAVAVLETAVHLDDHGLPMNRYLVRIEVPDDVWARRETLDMAALPVTWASIPAGRASVKIGVEWLASMRSAVLLVPSVIVPEESAALVNTRHPDAQGLRAEIVRRFEYNRLFRAG